ncbi:kinase domain protein (macronuclear) [Tetrahymena thermophila SB210]|uniref:Kinase domain protein n=1 Tax=Tetrahymena thermophila (strain SB210) TaxID=312017 RepID=I7LTM9_TETTS|nr:kinase domain protein [Tetrahymena thermophila SB210]EAR85538.2 kinase domain protein [Tetrahymena thermophila SB210]|eukprot:XP_001033201.2 kinase domain protein [Tetrahymena thermophila SB210]
MNEQNRDKTSSKISKKLQLTLNFNPQEILEIVYLEIELQMLPRDNQKSIDYIDDQKRIYLSKLENDDKDLNSCLYALYLEVFKIKKFYLASNKQSSSGQTTSLNQANNCINFCRQFIDKYISLLESDIRGRALIVFYLMIELFQCIEINDFFCIENIQKKYRSNIIVFFSNFNFTTIQKQQKKSTNPCLLKFYVSQFVGTLGIIQYELRQLKDSLENLDISVKIRNENLQEKSILERYLNTKQKILEYQLVIYYMKSKKCSCLLKMQRYAECCSFGQFLKKQIAKLVSSISSENKDLKQNKEIILQFENLSNKISQVLSLSNENAKNMLLGSDIQDILYEMRGNQHTLVKEESSLDTQEYNQNNEGQIIEVNSPTNANMESDFKNKAFDFQYKFFNSKIATLENIPLDSQMKILTRIDDTQKGNISQATKNTNAILKDADIFSLKTLLLKDDQQKQQMKKAIHEQLIFKKLNSTQSNQNSKSIMNDIQKAINESYTDLDASQMAKGQQDSLNQKNQQSFKQINFSFKTQRQNSQNTLSMANVNKEEILQNQRFLNEQQLSELQMIKQTSKQTSGNNSQKDENKLTVPSQRAINLSNLQKQQSEKIKTEINLESNNQLRDQKDQKDQNVNKLRQKKLKLSPSRVNVTNISYFFKPQEQLPQQQKNLDFTNNLGKKKFIQKLLDKESQNLLQEKYQKSNLNNIGQNDEPVRQNYFQNQGQIFNIKIESNNNEQDDIYYNINERINLQALQLQQMESERSQQGYLFTETRPSEPNIITLDTQKKKTLSTQNTQSNQEQYFQFNTLQTQQRTINTEQDIPLQNALKTESSNIKQRKIYNKIKLDQFQQFEVNQLIDGSQTERSHLQSDLLSQQLSPSSFLQFNQRPDYFNKALTQMKSTQASQSTQNSPKNSRQYSVYQQLTDRNNNIQLVQQNQRKNSNAQSAQNQQNYQQQVSPSRNFANVVNRDQLIKQISNYSQPKLRVNSEYNLIQQDDNLEVLQKQQQNQQEQSQAQCVNNNRSNQTQTRQMHYNRANKLRKSSLSPNQSNLISQIEQHPSINLSKQQSYTPIGSLQEFQLAKQSNVETQSNQINLVPKINFELLNQESLQYFEQIQNEKFNQNNKILSPNTTNFTSGSAYLSSQLQYGQQSQQTHSPSFAKKFSISQNIISQLPLQISRDKSNLSEKFYMLEEQDKPITRKRYSRSTNISRQIRQNSAMRNRFLSSHRKSHEKFISGQTTPRQPNSFAEKLQASFNSQNVVQNGKSVNLLNTTLNLKVKTDQYDAKNQIEFYDQNLILQRSDNNNLTENAQSQKIDSKIKVYRSISNHARVRPKTASVTKNSQRSLSQHSNVDQQRSVTYMQNSNTNILNYFKNINQTPTEKVIQKNYETPTNNQIQVRQKLNYEQQKRPQSSTIKNQSRQEQPYNTMSCNNLQQKMTKNVINSQSSQNKKNTYPINDLSEKGVTTTSTKSRSDYYLENALLSNQVQQQQPSALQMVLNEIQFQKKLNEVIESERKQNNQKNKISIKSIIGKFKEEEETLLKCMENASMLLDQQYQKRFLQDGSFYAIKSLKRIHEIPSLNQFNNQEQQQQLQKQPSIEKQFDESQNQNEDISYVSNQQDFEQDEVNMSSSKKSQINKLKSEIQRVNEQIQQNYFPEQEQRGEQQQKKQSQTDLLNRSKKSKFAKPDKKKEESPFQKRHSIVQTSAFYSQAGSPKSSQFKGNQQINNNFLFQMKDEFDDKQLNYQDSLDGHLNNNVLLTVQQDTLTENQDSDTIKMEDYIVQNYSDLQQSKFNRQKTKQPQQPKESIFQASQNQDLPENSLDFIQNQIGSNSLIQNQKQWHSQQHKLQINKSSKFIDFQPNFQKNNNIQLSDLNGFARQLSESNTVYQQLNSPLFTQQSSSSASNYFSRRINLQLKVPKNLELKRTKLSFPSFSNLEIASTLSRQNGRSKQIQIIDSSNKQSLKKLSKEQIRSITYFNQSLKFKSQTLIKSNVSFYDSNDQGEEKKKVVTLFKLLEETNKSYEVRDKLINSISGLIKGIKVLDTQLAYPPIIYYIQYNSISERIRLSINLQKKSYDADELYNEKFNINTRSRINSESDQSKNCNEQDFILEREESQDIEVELVIQYGKFQKIYIPINLTRGLLEHPVAERKLLVTVWPLVFKEMERYLDENHLIDVTNKDMLGLEDYDQEEVKLIIYENNKQNSKSMAFRDEVVSLNESQSINSDNKIEQGYNKSPLVKQKVQTIQNIQLDHIQEISKSSNSDMKQSFDTIKKSLTMNLIPNQKSLEDDLVSYYPTTSDSSVNRKLNILREQFEDLKMTFQFFGGLEQYFAKQKSPDAQIIVQKRKKKILSLIDLHEIQGLKDKVNSFLRFSFIYLQKEIGRGFCQDFNNESYYRYLLKHLMYLKKQYLRFKAGVIEFPDEQSAQPLLISKTPIDYPGSACKTPQQQIQFNLNQLTLNSETKKMKSPLTSKPSLNIYGNDKQQFGSTLDKKSPYNLLTNIPRSENILPQDQQNFTIMQNSNQSFRNISVANSNIRKTIFMQQNMQKQVQSNYFRHLKETQTSIQNALNIYTKSSPALILSFLKRNQDQYFLIIAKLVIKQEVIFNNLFNENGEFDIKDNYYFYISARQLNSNLKQRNLLPPIEITQEQLKPYYNQGEYRLFCCQINKFIIFGDMNKKQKLQLLYFLNHQIGITPQDKSDATKLNKQKILFKDTIALGQKIQVADWDSTLAYNLELYRIIFRKIKQQSLFDGTAVSEELSKGYYNLFVNNFNEVYQEHGKSKRVALSVYHNYESDAEEDKQYNQANKKQNQQNLDTHGLPMLNNDSQLQININQEQTQEVPNLQLNRKKTNSNYQFLEDRNFQQMQKYYPQKVQQFLKRKREWYLTLGKSNRMRVNFHFDWKIKSSIEEFKIYFFDLERQKKFCIKQVPLKIQNILIRLIKWEQEKYAYLDHKASKNFQLAQIQNVFFFEAQGFTGIKPVIKINKELSIKTIIITSQKSIKEHLISNSSDLLKYYHLKEYQFCMNMNLYGKCISNLKFYIMKRPQLNYEHMYAFLLIIQPLNSKTKQIKFVFSFQDLIMLDNNQNITENLKKRFTRADATKVIKLVSTRIRLIRGLFGAFPILMTEQQAKTYEEFKKQNQQSKIKEQLQKQNAIKQRALRQQSQQLQIINAISPVNQISAQAQIVRSARPSLFSKINSLFQKDSFLDTKNLNQGLDQSNTRRKSQFFEQSIKQIPNKNQLALQPVISSQQESLTSSNSDSSQSSITEKINDKISPSAKSSNAIQKINFSEKNNKQSSPANAKRIMNRPPNLNLGKEQLLTFSSKLQDMGILQNKITANENKQFQDKFVSKELQNQDEQTNSNNKYIIQKQISSSTITPLMSFLKTKKEVKAEINSNKSLFNSLNMNNDLNKKQYSSMRSSYNGKEGNKQEKNKMEHVFKRTESIDSQESQESNRISKNENSNVKSIQPRKVSFVDKAKDQNEHFNQLNTQSQHGILKKARQFEANDQQSSYTSPRVSFKIQEQSIEESLQIDSSKSKSNEKNISSQSNSGHSNSSQLQSINKNEIDELNDLKKEKLNTNESNKLQQNSEKRSDYEGTNNIFQDLRVFKNIISRHDFSDGKQNLTNTNKGFLESYLQKSRIIGQYVRKMANNEYVLITVKKDFILKCWDIQIYIPKTQRVLLSQLSHSELIDCNYDFLNRNIATKLRFFYENKTTAPFESYLSFLNRVNQYSNRMSTPDITKIQKNNNNDQGKINSFQKQSKNNFLSSIITKLKNSDESQTSPESLNASPLPEYHSPRNTHKKKSILLVNSIENNLLKRQTSNKKLAQTIKERDQNEKLQNSIQNNLDLQKQQQLFIQQNQIDLPKEDYKIKQGTSENQTQQNYLESPYQRSSLKKVSFIKLISIEDEESKDGESSKRTNKSGSQKSLHMINQRSNDENTPTSSNSSKISFQKNIQSQKNPESPSIISRMLESSRRKGQRKLTFKLDEQQQQHLKNVISSSSCDEQAQNSSYSKKSYQEKLNSPLNRSIQSPFDKKDQQGISEMQQNTESLNLSTKKSSQEQQTQNVGIDNDNQNIDQAPRLQENKQPNNQNISSSQFNKDKGAQNLISQQQSLLLSMHNMRSYSKNIFSSSVNQLKKVGGSTRKMKTNNQIQKLNQLNLVHSNSLVEESQEGGGRLRSQTGQLGSSQQQQSSVVQRTLKFFQTKTANKQAQQINQGNLENNSDSSNKGTQKKNLKQLISQNQQKIIGERNLIALVDFMKPKQFEKVTLQQKMLSITEEMDIAFMTGCPNERIDNLVRFIEIKIWSNFLSQCEFRTDDKHFKVVLFFGSNKLSIQEQLFHDYIKVDQQNESVIEVGVDLQESILFLNKDAKLPTRVQLLQYFFNSFKSIPYTMTSNFSFTVQNVIINKRSIKKFNVNVRELLNLFIAEGFYRFQTNYMSSKVSYSELKNLAYFLIHKIKNSNFLELMQNQEKNISIDKAKSKNNPQQNQGNNLSTSFAKLNTLNSINQIPSENQIISYATINIQQQARQQKKKKQKRNFIILKDDNLMYFYEKVINVQLKLIMKVSYFTRSHQFQIVVYKSGTSMSIIRNKSLKYFNKKIPFIQQYMKQLDLFDTALSRVCDYMVDKMILYFIIQHNLHQDERYIKKLHNNDKQRKKFSVFLVNNIYQLQEQTSSEEIISTDQNIYVDSEDSDSQQGDQQDDEMTEDFPVSQYEFNDTLSQNQSNRQIQSENEVRFFSSKSLTPIRMFQNSKFQKLKGQRSLFVQGSSDSSFISKENQSPNQSMQSQNQYPLKKSSSFDESEKNDKYQIQDENLDQEYVDEEEEYSNHSDDNENDIQNQIDQNDDEYFQNENNYEENNQYE